MPRQRPRFRSEWPRIAISLIVVIVLGIAIYVVFPRPRPRNVILVSIDTLRADRLGTYGYKPIRTPHIDRIAREGVVFENAATATPLTLPAHASIFTGRTPLRHGVIDNFGSLLAEDEQTLAEALAARGFATAGFVGAFVLDSRWGVAQGFDTYFDRFDPRGRVPATPLASSERPGNEVLEPALEWIGRQGERPFFCFIHFFDPHTPYAPPEPYRSRYGPETLGLYDGEVAFADSLVGELVSALEEQGVYEDTLMIVMGDHGESLGDHGEMTHGLFIYDATTRVPLILRSPGVDGGARIAAQVRTIDVMPTVLDLLEIETPAVVEGTSLRPLLGDPAASLGLTAYMESHYSQSYFGWAPLVGLRSERYKFIEAPREELYDLQVDPGETGNLAGEKPELVKQFSESLSRLTEKRAIADEPIVLIDPETEQRLQSLGYITTRIDSPAPEGGTLPDPKDKIDLFNRFTEAWESAQLGKADQAVKLLSSVLEEDPSVLLAYYMLGNIQLQHRSYDRAELVFRDALTVDESSFEASYGLALALKGRGRTDDAARAFERCLELKPKSVRSAYQLAEVRLAQGKPGEAEKTARKALQAVSNTSLRLTLADALLAQERKEEAMDILRQSEVEDPENVLVHLSMGNLLFDQGDVDGAQQSFQKVTRLAPDDARGFNALGNALASKGEAGEAYLMFRKAVEADALFAPAQNNLGIALAGQGKDGEAERAFRQAISSDPSYAEAYNNLGFLYLRAGAVQQAIPLFRKALGLRPDYGQARANLDAALAHVSSHR